MLFTFLLGVVVLTILPGCFETEEIVTCLGASSPPSSWFGRPPLTVCMRAIVDHGGVCTWDFGDGASDTGEVVTHTFTEVGEYAVVLDVVYPNSGKLATLSTTVVVAGEPVAAFSYKAIELRSGIGNWFIIVFPWLAPSEPPDEQPESLTVEFDSSTLSYPTATSEMYRPAQVQWSFGDGTQETKQVSGMSWWPWTPSDMIIRHTYLAAGVYTVTLTLTDNLGYSDTVTQTITVGTPGDDEVLVEDFELGPIYWELDDEEEDDCIYVDGTVQNNASVAAGVELTATAYNAIGTPVGTFTYWPAGSTNIGVGVDYAYSFFLCDLSVPGEQVVDVEVIVTDAVVH